jgi:hypothetical protein
MQQKYECPKNLYIFFTFPGIPKCVDLKNSEDAKPKPNYLESSPDFNQASIMKITMQAWMMMFLMAITFVEFDNITKDLIAIDKWMRNDGKSGPKNECEIKKEDKADAECGWETVEQLRMIKSD